MTTLNYTSTAGDPALDAAFERALATARAGRPEPLAHLIGGHLDLVLHVHEFGGHARVGERGLLVRVRVANRVPSKPP